MTTLDTAFQGVREERRSKPPFPDKLWHKSTCSVCHWFVPDSFHFIFEWAAENRPDTLVTDGSGLSHMFSCKCVQDANAAGHKREKESNLPWIQPHIRRSLRSFHTTTGTGDMTTAVAAFCRREGAPMLVLSADIGAGKTHLLEAIGNSMLAQSSTVRYERAEDLVERIRYAKSIDSVEDVRELLAWYNSFDTMLIDDLGMVPSTDKGSGYLTALVDDRYATERRLVIATNLTSSGVAREYGSRLADRMFNKQQSVKTVVSEAKSYRQEGGQ
jgi:DNA replication protein DnaC